MWVPVKYMMIELKDLEYNFRLYQKLIIKNGNKFLKKEGDIFISCIRLDSVHHLEFYASSIFTF